VELTFALKDSVLTDFRSGVARTGVVMGSGRYAAIPVFQYAWVAQQWVLDCFIIFHSPSLFLFSLVVAHPMIFLIGRDAQGFFFALRSNR